MLAQASNRSRILASSFALFCFGLLMSAYSARNPNVSQIGYWVLAEAVAPLQRVSRAAHDAVADTWSNYIALVGTKAENQKLKQQILALQDRNLALVEFQHENERLRRLLSLAEDPKVHGVAARVIGHGPSSWVRSVTVNKGGQEGIRKGMAVVVGQRVVGQVVEVARNSAHVLLITDHASGVDVLVQSSRARGILEGSGRGKARLQFVSLEDDVGVGEQVITSGFDGVYPRGLLVGVVSRVRKLDDALFYNIDVEPAIDFSKLEELFVVFETRADEE